MNKAESKYFNTAKRMVDALLALLEKKDFQYISVKEVCAEAEVSRSTFYLHYENTAELLTEAVEMLHERFFTRFPEAELGGSAILYKPKEELFFITDKWLLPYLEFVRENKSVYKAIHSQMEVFGGERAYREFFQRVFSPILSRFGVSEEKHEYMMTFYRHGLTALVMRWAEADCRESPAEIGEAIKLCVGEAPK